MDIFLDTANIDEINKWLGMGVIDGVTTNPSIMRKDGVTDFKDRAKEIADIMYPCPVSVEVTTDDLDKMLEQATELSEIARNIVVKIPQLTRYGVPCYGVIHDLEPAVQVNATAALSLGQLMLAAKAGATYVSLFVGRVSDEGGDAFSVVRNSARWLDYWGYDAKIIAGSLRSVGDAMTAAKAGAHVITVPPPILAKMADHRYARATVEQFLSDAQGGK